MTGVKTKLFAGMKNMGIDANGGVVWLSTWADKGKKKHKKVTVWPLGSLKKPFGLDLMVTNAVLEIRQEKDSRNTKTRNVSIAGNVKIKNKFYLKGSKTYKKIAKGWAETGTSFGLGAKTINLDEARVLWSSMGGIVKPLIGNGATKVLDTTNKGLKVLPLEKFILNNDKWNDQAKTDYKKYTLYFQYVLPTNSNRKPNPKLSINGNLEVFGQNAIETTITLNKEGLDAEITMEPVKIGPLSLEGPSLKMSGINMSLFTGKVAYKEMSAGGGEIKIKGKIGQIEFPSCVALVPFKASLKLNLNALTRGPKTSDISGKIWAVDCVSGMIIDGYDAAKDATKFAGKKLTDVGKDAGSYANEVANVGTGAAEATWNFASNTATSSYKEVSGWFGSKKNPHNYIKFNRDICSDSRGGAYRIFKKNRYKKWCIDIYDKNNKGNFHDDNIVIRACNDNSETQKWRYFRSRIMFASCNKWENPVCFDAEGSVGEGHLLNTWKCHQEGNQKFVYDFQEHKIKSKKNSSLCLDSDNKHGDPLRLKKCTDSDQWFMEKVGG